MAAKQLVKLYPWLKTPVITNAPMAWIAGPKLVAQVTRAGGFGFLGAGYNADAIEGLLQEFQTELASAGGVPAAPAKATVPVGVGLLIFANELEQVISIVGKQAPAALWLFAPRSQLAEYGVWTRRVREACPATTVWIQVGSVAEAVEVARLARPDVLVVQGSDAGGHGIEKTASVMALLPEVADALAATDEPALAQIPLLAAGGIADGRGLAAALALGAAGAVIGTRFLGAPEAVFAAPAYQQAVLAARDGGQTTERSKIFDQVMGKPDSVWPAPYDGRAFRNASTADAAAGLPLAQNRDRFHAAVAEPNKGFQPAVSDTRANIWAGAAVGLVNTLTPAADIVQSTRAGAVAILKGFTSSL